MNNTPITNDELRRTFKSISTNLSYIAVFLLLILIMKVFGF